MYYVLVKIRSIIASFRICVCTRCTVRISELDTIRESRAESETEDRGDGAMLVVSLQFCWRFRNRDSCDVRSFGSFSRKMRSLFTDPVTIIKRKNSLARQWKKAWSLCR